MNAKRNTLQKQLIHNAVATLDIHATAEQVYEHVAQSHPSVSKATVYRNLRQMSEAGELLNIGAPGAAHYDHRCHEHSHFVCQSCQQVFDVEGNFSDVIARAANTPGLKVDDYQLLFSGTCEKCAQLEEACLMA